MLLGLSMLQGLLVPPFGKRENHPDKHSGHHKSSTLLGLGSLCLLEHTMYQDRTDLVVVSWLGLGFCPNAAGRDARNPHYPATLPYPRHHWLSQHKCPRQTWRLASPEILPTPKQTKYRRFSNCHLHLEFCFQRFDHPLPNDFTGSKRFCQ